MVRTGKRHMAQHKTARNQIRIGYRKPFKRGQPAPETDGQLFPCGLASHLLWAAQLLLIVGLAFSQPACGSANTGAGLVTETSPIETASTVGPGSTAGEGLETEETVDLFPAPIGHKDGYIDREGRLVIEARYGSASDFHGGLALVCEESEDGGTIVGYIDATGRVVLRKQHERSQDFSNGLALVSDGEGGGLGYMDKTGRVVFSLPAEYSEACSFSEGLAAVETEAGWGYIDTTGQLVIEPQYLSAYPFSEGLAAASTWEGYGFIDKTGRFVVEPQFFSAGGFGEGLAPVSREVPEVVGAWFEEWAYIDRTGQLAMPYQFTLAFSFASGLAPVLLTGADSSERPGGTPDGWYFIDTTGSVVLGPFDWARPFHNGMAFVGTLDGQNAYIDTTGAIVWSAPNVWLQENDEPE